MVGQWREEWKPNERTLLLLVALLAFDVTFVLLHATRVRYDLPAGDRWLISRDRGYPEMFQYLKELAIVGLLVGLAKDLRHPLYLVWSVFFTYLLLDDALEIHETVGEALGDGLGVGTMIGIEQRDLGQIIVSGAVGLALVVVLALAYRRDDSRARDLTKILLALISALAFFGVVTDVVDALDVFGIVEDGGEMVMISLTLCVVFDFRARVRTAPPLVETVGS